MIEMLNQQSNWGKIKAGLKGGDRYSGQSPKQKLRFQKAPAMTKEANPVLENVFTGKSFSQRKK